jgi:hypothetical protein
MRPRVGSLVVAASAMGCGPNVGHEEHGEPTTGGAETGAPLEPEPEPYPCFATRVLYDGLLVGAVQLADTRGDGLPEIWLSWVDPEGSPRRVASTGFARTGEGHAVFASASFGSTTRLVWADLDGDGRDDAIYAPRIDDVTVWRGRRSDAAGMPSDDLEMQLSPDLEDPVAWFDVTLDGRADVFASEGGLLRIAAGDGLGGFSETTKISLEPWDSARSILPSRVDRRAFAVTLNPTCPGCPTALTLVAPLGPDGLEVRYATSALLDDPVVLDMRPIDEDERPDVLVRHVASTGERVVDVFLARDDGTLRSVRQIPVGDVALAGDFDGDGRLDLMWTRDEEETYVLSDVVGATEPRRVEVDPLPFDLDDFSSPNRRERRRPPVADIDGDGRDEIVQWRDFEDLARLEAIEVRRGC